MICKVCKKEIKENIKYCPWCNAQICDDNSQKEYNKDSNTNYKPSNKSKGKSGMLITFIGLIISMFTGFGYILTTIGLFMTGNISNNLKRSGKFFIGALIFSNSIIALLYFSRVAVNYPQRVIIILLIAAIVIILTLIFSYNSYKYLLYGCKDIFESKNEVKYVRKCEKLEGHYKNSLLTFIFLILLAIIFYWVPILNIILIILSVVASIYYIVVKIFVIVRVIQAYSKL